VILSPYLSQSCHWPARGRHILAQFDQASILVYQAFRPSIASFAVSHQCFGGDFSYSRMSWIKPNFLWMMYRSGWASKPGQERILAVRLRRHFFDELLRTAVPSGYCPGSDRSREEWQHAVATSDVRLQWDPDHDPSGRPLERRAIQIGLRGNALMRYGNEALLSIEDITPFVVEQRASTLAPFSHLVTPWEAVYEPEPFAGEAVGIDIWPAETSC
jgi:hypothetical protein